METNLEYRRCVSRISSLSRTYVFDMLIVLLLAAAMLEVLVGRNSPDAPESSLWFVLPAIAILVIPVLARRRFAFAPAGHWVLAIGIAFVDWRLIPFAISIFVVGLIAAFLLGNLRDSLQAALGLAFVIAGPLVVVYRIPGHSAAQLVFIPLQFRAARVPGFALRGGFGGADGLHPARVRDRVARGFRRARALRAGRGGRGTRGHCRARARRGSSDRRCRGARANRARAPRHRRPRGQRDGASGRRGPAQAAGWAGRGQGSADRRRADRTHGPRRDAPAAGGDARRGRRARADASTGARKPRLAAREGRPRRAAGAAARRGRAVPRSPRDRPLRLPNRAGGPDERPQARSRDERRRDPRLPARGAAPGGA